MISSLLAGIGSGTIASIVCAPLDLIRTRMQVMGSLTAVEASRNSLHIVGALKDIAASDGVRGCFRGLGATLATVPAFWGLYFPLYEYLKEEISRNAHQQYYVGNDSLVHMSSAILAGGVADFVCNPMFIVRTRMQTESLHSPDSHLTIRGTIRSLYHEGGIPVFWRGLTASLLGLSHVAIQFPVYEACKKEARQRSPDNKERPLDLILASGISKLCASSVTYPHEVIRSRMMDARGIEMKSFPAWVKTIVHDEGYLGLYRGLHVSLARVVPNCCITFVSYEMFLRWSRDYLDKHHR